MTLGQKQELFTYCLAKLIGYMADRNHYEVRLKEVLRTEYQAREYARLGKGIINSNHRNGVAADLYFSQGGVLLWDGPAYITAANYWKGFTDNECEFCWGGDFSKYRDVYHYSIKHGGTV